jgi:hypothetical protein
MVQHLKLDPLIFALAIIGGAFIYANWTFYQRQAAEQQRHELFSATPAPSMPNLSKPKPINPENTKQPR